MIYFPKGPSFSTTQSNSLLVSSLNLSPVCWWKRAAAPIFFSSSFFFSPSPSPLPPSALLLFILPFFCFFSSFSFLSSFSSSSPTPYSSSYLPSPSPSSYSPSPFSSPLFLLPLILLLLLECVCHGNLDLISRVYLASFVTMLPQTAEIVHMLQCFNY